jgi:uncharacterized protein
MDRDTLERAAASLPVFPLPRIVLMPRDLLPLHVFEPRYRALVAEVTSTNGLLGMATLKPGFEADYNGSPPIFEAISVGAVIRHSPLPDGRSNIVVQWLARGTALEELPSTPFRRFRVGLRPDVHLDAPFTLLRSLVVQLGAYSPEASEEAVRLAGLPGDALVDHIAGRVLETPEERLAYVAEDDLEARARMIELRLADLVGTAGTPVAEA